MGRYSKKGLEYFPFDVDFFQDLKIRKLIRYQGGKAVAVYALLLCNIYKNGYYMRWDSELPFIISEQTGYDEAYIQEVIKCCMVLGLFDDALYKSDGVLTSRGIQVRYVDILTKLKRTADIVEFSLITPVSSISSEKIPISSEEMPIYSEEIAINSEDMHTKEKGKRKKINNIPLLSNESVPPLQGETPPKPSRKRFVRPTVDEVRAYCRERGNNVDAQRFLDFYESKGWKVGNSPMKDWKACVRTWEQRDNTPKQSPYQPKPQQQETDWDELERQRQDYIRKLREREQKEKDNGI